MKTKLLALAMIFALVLCALPIMTAAEESLDYSALDAAVATAKTLNKDEYKDFTAVENAVAAASAEPKPTTQEEVDQRTKAINDAIAALVAYADYSKVDESLKKISAMDKNDYKDFSKVEAAVAKVVRGKLASDQALVDYMAASLQSAITFLELKDADYTEVNKALAAVKKLDPTSYKDFSAVNAAVAAVVTGKMADEQESVDAMAKAINDAIDGLESINPPTSDYAVIGCLAVAAVASFSGIFLIRKREA